LIVQTLYAGEPEVFAAIATTCMVNTYLKPINPGMIFIMAKLFYLSKVDLHRHGLALQWRRAGIGVNRNSRRETMRITGWLTAICWLTIVYSERSTKRRQV